MVPVEISSLLKNLKVTHCSPSETLKLMLQNDFPNIYILLRHYWTLPVTNCTGEPSFSHLKRIKSALRSTQTQERLRLNNLSLLNTESSDLLQKLDFSTVIEVFSSAKCTKRSFWLSEVYFLPTQNHVIIQISNIVCKKVTILYQK